MHYTDPVYRPLYEAGSLLIEAMIGSSQNANRSALCTGDSLFPPSLWTRSGKTFLEARGDRVKGIIRVNGDAFALPIRKRKAIGELIAAIFRQILIKRCPSEGP